MDNIDFLSKILSTDYEYWIVSKKNEYNTIARQGRGKDSIIYLVIPKNINRNIKYEEIKLVDLKILQKSNIECNIFLNESYPPFQQGQDFYNIYDGHPIEKNQKQILIKALELESDNLWDYKKLIDEACSEQTHL